MVAEDAVVGARNISSGWVSSIVPRIEVKARVLGDRLDNFAVCQRRGGEIRIGGNVRIGTAVHNECSARAIIKTDDAVANGGDLCPRGCAIVLVLVWVLFDSTFRF